jgi:hypothetical protein
MWRARVVPVNHVGLARRHPASPKPRTESGYETLPSRSRPAGGCGCHRPVVLLDLGQSVRVEGYAEAALIAPDRNAAATHIFVIDFEIEHPRKRNVVLQDEPGAAARSVQDEAPDAHFLEVDRAVTEHRPSRGVRLVSLQAITHLTTPHISALTGSSRLVHQHCPIAPNSGHPDIGLSDSNPERCEHGREQLID